MGQGRLGSPEAKPELLGGGGHQHHRGPADHLDGRDVDQVAIFGACSCCSEGCRRLIGGGFGNWWGSAHTV